MDKRQALADGTILSFPGMICTVTSPIGKGSNAIVYKGWYCDNLNREKRHHVLIKELFPYHPRGLIYRREDGSIAVDGEAEEMFRLHRLSFTRGNEIHLHFLEKSPERIGGNINTFTYNKTLYTVLGYEGGRTLDHEYPSHAKSLRECVQRTIEITDALAVFHDAGYLHLDISPDNILRIGDGTSARTILIDYNSMHTLEELRDGKTIYYSAKEGYTALEIRIGNPNAIGKASDIFSLTAVFYRLLTGQNLTPMQLLAKRPPDGSESPLLRDAPACAAEMVRQILFRGLASLPGKRYPDTASIRTDLEELCNRIDGIGITRWALWEAGQKSTAKIIRDNPSMRYIADKERLYPMRIRTSGGIRSAEDLLRDCIAENGTSFVLQAAGGMGKTTALLSMMTMFGKKYSPVHPVPIYISLYDWNDSGDTFIRDRILENLRFGHDVDGMKDARRRLGQLFEESLKTRNGTVPSCVLMLDGINEAIGNTEPLWREIACLEACGGVRLILSTRSLVQDVGMPVCEMLTLAAEDITDALGREGLLMPEKTDMQTLLATPLMLSIYIKTANNSEKQYQIRTGNELMDMYFKSLCEKEMHGQPENTSAGWSAEAALHLVLPAFAGKISECGRSLNNTELLRIIEKCWKLVRSRKTEKLYSSWIGHSTDILCGAAHAEEWFGIIVRQLLWNKMGLIVRDEQGKYRIVHQHIEEYLLVLYKKNQTNLAKITGRRILTRGGALLLGTSAAVFLLNVFLLPECHDEISAFSVLESVVSAQTTAGLEIETMRSMLSGDDDMYEIQRTILAQTLDSHTVAISEGYIGSSIWAVAALDKLMQSGEVMPWSYQKLNEAAYKELFSTYESFAGEYGQYALILDFLRKNESYDASYGGEFREMLAVRIEADAALADALYKVTAADHLEGMAEKEPEQYGYYIQTVASVGNLSSREPDECDLAVIEELKKARNEATAALNDSVLFTIYRRSGG